MRFHDREGRVALCGEVKMPWSPEGRSPYDAALLRDAHEKADNVGARFFFTWNVNTLVLWDRQKWNVSPLEREFKEWKLGARVANAADLERPDVQRALYDGLLPRFLEEFAAIYTGQVERWSLPPDERFVRVLDSHLDWPVRLALDWLGEESGRNRHFSVELERWMATGQQWTFERGDPRNWQEALDRAARTLCYLLSNRMIFYEAVRARFRDLPPLRLPRQARDPAAVYFKLHQQFQEAVERTGDYEPIFYPPEKDPMGAYLFAPAGALAAWGGFLGCLERYDLGEVRQDILGNIFQRLISPEERHRWGQHYTNQDIVDVINAFCLRKADATVLDPACGSGSFLVRAYYRKGWLDARKRHQELLSEIYGCDISLFAAHLATLNLAARRIEDEENYPQIARKNFFEVERGKPFCHLPGWRGGENKREERAVMLPELDAVVGNPPYVRQELIPRKDQKSAPHELTKEYLQALVKGNNKLGLQVSGRSDFHVYFWPVATRLLRPDGWFGFLTSSSAPLTKSCNGSTTRGTGRG